MKISVKKKIYVYPKLPAGIDFGCIRIGGSGLGNCMFVAARAWAIAKHNNYHFIEPNWVKFSIGPYIRSEKDKRHYFGLFNKLGYHGFRKLLILLRQKKITIEQAKTSEKGVIVVEGLSNYFGDLLNFQVDIKDYFELNIKKKILRLVDQYNFEKSIGIHIRLGDYVSEWRTDIKWYESIINQLNEYTHGKYDFLIFSDGTDDELKSLLQMSNCKRVFFGNSIVDIIALGRCRLIVGSDSTFSGWAAFLGQNPIIFPKRHFSKVLINEQNEIVLNSSNQLTDNYLQNLSL